MMRDSSHLTHEFLSECFTEKDGLIFWKERPSHHFTSERLRNIFNSRLAGKEAGHLDRKSKGDPRVIINMNKVMLKRSHIIWCINKNIDFHRGLYIDHIDRNTLNDKISNLRLATRSQNQGNRKINSNNTSGYKGVKFAKHMNKWVARISMNGKRIHLGYFDDPEKAHEAYVKAAVNHFGEFAHSG